MIDPSMIKVGMQKSGRFQPSSRGLIEPGVRKSTTSKAYARTRTSKRKMETEIQRKTLGRKNGRVDG